MSAGEKAPAQGPRPSTAADRAPAPAAAWAYMLRCADGSLYSGWTNDLARRIRAHTAGRGAKYTRGHGGERLAYAEHCADKSAAMRREAALKKLPKAEKEALAARWARESTVSIRMAAPADAPAVAALYNRYVLGDTATFQYEPSTPEEYRQNIAEVLEKAPFLVAYNGAGALCGYACAHPWHTRAAYAWDVETTIYCAPEAIGQGVGGRLYRALIALLKNQGYYNAYALVARPNPGSDAFHRAMGFTCFGVEPRTGYKFGQWLGLSYWVLPLRPDADPPRPVRFAPEAEVLRAVLAEANR